MSDTALELQGLRIDALSEQPELQALVRAVFGPDDDEVPQVLERARHLFEGRPVVVWEADPLTFSFTYVSPEAQDLLGYPVEAWMQPGFWNSQVVHPEDAGDALSHCAMATAAGTDHDFEYRALHAHGHAVRVHDVVHVLKGPLGFATRLRGIMFPVDAAA
jgi:PAS domain-containing protein